MLAALGNNPAVDPVFASNFFDDIRKLFQSAVRLIFVIVNTPAIGFQLAGKMSHATEKQGNLLFVVFDIGGFFIKLGHDNEILPAVKRLQRRQVAVQLVAQYQSSSHKSALST